MIDRHPWVALNVLPPRLVEGPGARIARAPAIPFAAGLAVAMLVVEAMRPDRAAPFIYYQF